MTQAKRKLLIGGGIGVAVVASFISVGLMEQGQEKNRLSSARINATRVGIPLSEEEYDRLFPQPSQEQNAWPLYVETIRLYHSGIDASATTERFNPPSEREDAFRPIYQDMARWLAGEEDWRPSPEALEALSAADDVIQSAHKIPTRELFYNASRFKRGLAQDFPECVFIQDLASLLLYDALNSAARGDFDRAKRDLNAAAMAANHLLQMPIWHTFDVGITTASHVMAVGRWMVTSETWPSASLQQLQEAIEPALQVPDFRRIFLGVLYRGWLTLDSMSSEAKMREAGFGRRALTWGAPRPAIREATEISWLEAGSGILRDWPADDPRALRKLMAERQADLVEPLRAYNNILRFRTEVTRSLEALVVQHQSHLAKARLMKALFQGLREKSQSGAMPSSIPLSGEDARDPFRGGDLKLEQSDSTWLIYSEGPNEQDDNGSAELDGRFPKDWRIRYPDRRTGW